MEKNDILIIKNELNKNKYKKVKKTNNINNQNNYLDNIKLISRRVYFYYLIDIRFSYFQYLYIFYANNFNYFNYLEFYWKKVLLL